MNTNMTGFRQFSNVFAFLRLYDFCNDSLQSINIRLLLLLIILLLLLLLLFLLLVLVLWTKVATVLEVLSLNMYYL